MLPEMSPVMPEQLAITIAAFSGGVLGYACAKTFAATATSLTRVGGTFAEKEGRRREASCIGKPIRFTPGLEDGHGTRRGVGRLNASGETCAKFGNGDRKTPRKKEETLSVPDAQAETTVGRAERHLAPQRARENTRAPT